MSQRRNQRKEDIGNIMNTFMKKADNVMTSDDEWEEWESSSGSDDCFEIFSSVEEKARIPKKRKWHVNRFSSLPSFEEVTKEYNEKDFELEFRMPKRTSINFLTHSDLILKKMKTSHEDHPLERGVSR